MVEVLDSFFAEVLVLIVDMLSGYYMFDLGSGRGGGWLWFLFAICLV
jgi:hypothetical protein